MTELVGAGGARRLVLGFDAECGTCSGLAQRIHERVGEKLVVRNLHDPEVVEWREGALGKAAPWAPTLFEVEGEKVRAWVGVKMGLALSRRLGPKDTWRVMQILGEIGAAPGIEGTVEESALVGKLHGKAQEAVLGMSRGQFLKGLGGAAVATSVLSSAALFPSGAQAATSPLTSTGTLTQRNLAKSIVRNTQQYKALASQQAQIGATFDFGRAVVKINKNVATVFLTSDHRRKAVVVMFFVNLRTRTLMNYQGTALTRYGSAEVRVTRLVNRTPVAPHRWVNVGKNYVVTETGARMTITQFRETCVRLAQRNASQLRVPQTSAYDQCRIDQAAYCQSFNNYVTGGCVVGEIGSAVIGVFVPPLGLALGGAFLVSCAAIGVAGCTDPELACKHLLPPPPPPTFVPC